MASSERFGGRIGRTYQDSDPWWPLLPEDAHGPRPNVVVILFDDTGFAQLGCYGSTIDTPNIDALAAKGLRFSNFHVTPLCSPTRASLLTGRNHHAVGMRTVANYHDGGFPNMRGSVSRHAATLAEMLQQEGYATFALGKWHLNPSEENSAAGPYDDWPLQRGFDRYYGFLPGATDQFYPELTYDNHHVDPPARPEDGYHVTEDLVDHAIGFLRDKQSNRPRQPFFMYFSPGAMHEPHQAPPEYIDKYRGHFDAGWDAVRQTYYERQQASGILPPGAELSPRNPGVLPWDDVPKSEQRFGLRLQEAFAGFLEHTDAQIGRLIRYLEEAGELDNTILVLTADNGTSQAAGPTGVMHAGMSSERSASNDGRMVAETDPANPRTLVVDDVDAVDLDKIGGPQSYTDIPWGWAQVGNTPLRWYKQDVHGGGVRVPLILHWPDRIAAAGIRHQFHHVSDVLPTVLEMTGLAAPDDYRGLSQMPVTGTSFAYVIDASDDASKKPVQYFECVGHRGIWADGWKAVTRHIPTTPFSDEEWELYHVDEDFSEVHNLSEAEPERLRELIDRWWVEAGRNGVLPLDDRTWVLRGPSKRPGGLHEQLRYHWTPPISRMPSGVAPPLGMGEWALMADVERAGSETEGVIFAVGSMNGGISVYVQDNRLHVAYNAMTKVTIADSTTELPAGRVQVGARLEADRGDGAGTIVLTVAGEEAGRTKIPSLVGGVGRGGADIGFDRLSPVANGYAAPFPFTGTIHSVDLEIQPYPGGGSAPGSIKDQSTAN